MKVYVRRTLTPIATLLLGACVATPPLTAQIAPKETVAVVGATVIDGTGAAPIADAVVLIENGVIVKVGTMAGFTIPEAARTVDATGRWITPGFVDTHAHLTLGPVDMDMSSGVPAMSLVPDPDVPLRTMRSLLAYGVTSIRDPGGDPSQLTALRAAVESGALVGPRMKVAGMVIDRTPFEGLVNTVSNEEELRAAVRADADAGVDIVKLYVTLTPELMEAAVEEAHAAGVETVAHTMMTSWTDAANLGLDNILHIIPGSPQLLTEDSRADYMGMMQRGTQFMYGWFEHVDFESAEIREMIEALVRNDVSVDPTLVIFEGMVRGDDPWYTENPALDLAAPSLVANWRAWFNFNTGWTPEDFVAGKAAWPRFLEFARRLHEAGVVITAGTDANNPWIVPGHSFHRELELLVEAGIPELEVLKIATHNGAEVSGLLDVTGTIEVGKSADLVLLTGNPLANISNSRKIEWVMQAGRVHQPAVLLEGIRKEH